MKTSGTVTEGASAYFKWAGWLHKKLYERKLKPRHLYHLCDERIAMHRIWKWLRGEGVPQLVEGILLFERLGAMPEPDVLTSTNAEGQQVKSHPELNFPGTRERKR